MELHGLIDILGKVRKRILTNTFLRGTMKWWTWVLISLIAVAAISVKLAGVMMLAAILVVGGTGFILSWIWRTRISIYDTACRLDSAAGLHDRLSTAIYLGDSRKLDEMSQLQREDALARLGKVNPPGLFPIRTPATAKRAAAVVLIAAGLLAYRIHHKPPLVSLLQTTERSQLVKSLLSPLVQAMEKDVRKTVALVTKPESDTEEVRSGDTKPPPDDLWQNGDEQQDTAQNGDQGVPDAGSDEQDQHLTGNQNGQNSSESPEQQQSSPSSQTQQSQNANNSTPNKPGDQQKSQQSETGSPSLGQSLMQALKNLVSNPQKQQSNSSGNQDSQQSNSQGMPQSGSSNSNNSDQNGQKGDSRGSSQSQQKPSPSTSNGAGSQAGLKQKRTDFDSHQVTAVPDRVALETNTYKEDMRMRTETEAGTSQMATHDTSQSSPAVVNGAEQENIPARYRMYVQHYFEHTPAGQQDNTQPVSAQPDNGQQQQVAEPGGAPPASAPQQDAPPQNGLQ